MSFDHPDIADLDLPTVLRALADPMRLDTVRRLAACADTSGGLNCSTGMPCSELPKATRSNHYKVLRAAGIVQTEKRGRDVLNRLRRAELDCRFPGLLDAVLNS